MSATTSARQPLQLTTDPSAPLPLSRLLAGEVVSAVGASALVAPFISIIDKSIIANASGVQPLREGITSGLRTLLTRPLYFVRQPAFLLIWGVYAGTYITANTIETLCTSYFYRSWQFPKFVGSSVANVTLSVAKDRQFTRMFGKGAPKPLPMPTYVLFGARDSLTILAGFNLPPILSQQLQHRWAVDKRWADVGCQLTVPCAVQFLSTPMHLLGLDLYNQPQRSVRERIAFLRQEYWKTSFARIARIFPAYGIGGVVNKKLRETLVLQQQHPNPQQKP